MNVVPRPDKSTPLLENDGRTISQTWFEYLTYLSSATSGGGGGGSGSVSGDNLLQNTNWQLFSKLIGTTSTVSRVNSSGTGLNNQIAVTGFTPNSGQPTLTTSNTQGLADGDLVVFGSGHGGLSGWALRVFSVVPNTSFKVQIPFGQSTPGVSSAQTAFPMGIYDSGSSTFGPDGGYTKTASLAMWADDYATNACPGSKRVLGLRKSVGTVESFKWNPRLATQAAAMRGRRVTFGMLVRQKVGGGAAKIYINDGTTVTYSTAVRGSSFVDAAYNNYQLMTVSAVISATAPLPYPEFGFEFNGSTNDICYLASWTVKYGSSMTANDLGQSPGELIRADTHWNPPCLVPFGSGVTPGQWPGAEIISGSGLYGWTDIDLEAISYGQCHNSVVKANCKIEYNTPQVGSICFIAALDIPAVQLTFGLQAQTSVANVVDCTNMSFVPLIPGTSTPGNPPGCFAMFSDKINGTITNITFDFDDVIA